MSSVTPTIAIIGGGFAGAVTAIRLAQTSTSQLRLVIIGNDPELGRGIAYGTRNTNHLVNGLAKTFGVIPEEPLHLAHWLRDNAASHGWQLPEGVPFEEAFPPRWLYGTYVQATLEQVLSKHRGTVAFEHVQAQATGLTRENGRYCIQTDQREIKADAVVLATGLQQRASLNVQGEPHSTGKVVSRLWDQDAWRQVADDQRLLVVGSSLTALDSIISADDAGFRGEYILLSRRGVLVQTRDDVAPWPDVLDPQALPNSLAELVSEGQKARRQIRKEGGHRQQLAGAIRPHVPTMWLSASLPDKLRFIRYLRPYWENILHRAAPESGKRLDAVTAAGRLQRRVGQLVKLTHLPSGQVQVTWRPRGTDDTAVFSVDRVVDAHGYEFDWHRSADPLVRSLLANGLVRRHATGFGIEADGVTGQVQIDGKPSPGLFAVGHPLRGASWESNSIGEQVIQAVAAVKTLTSQLSAHSPAVSEPAL